MLSSIRGQTERLQPPRALHCEFPLGRPLGRPNDPQLQRRILLSAFDLLNEKAGPVLETFPEKIMDGTAEPLACPMPERSDLNVIPAVDEARGLRSAYDRTFDRRGVSQVGRTCGPDEIPAMLEAFNLVADGVPWNEVGLLGNPIDVAMDIRAYYEEAAIALVDHVPSAQSGVSWLYQKTETGALMRAAQLEIKKQNLPYGPDTVSAPAGGYPPASRLWYYIMPQIQSDATFVDGTNLSVEEWEDRQNQ